LRLLFLLFFISFGSFSQGLVKFLLTPDTTLNSKVSVALKLDTRNSFSNSKFVNINGVSGGISFGRKRSKLLLGYYWANYKSNLRFIDFSKNRAALINLDYYTKIDLHYFNLMYYHYLINSYRWQLSFPVEVGIGTGDVSQESFGSDLQIWKKEDLFVPLQLGLRVDYKATRYLGLNVMAGYRHSLKIYELSNAFSGPYYSYGISLFTDPMWPDFKKWRATRKNSKVQAKP
jgi:hypothetical protein